MFKFTWGYVGSTRVVRSPVALARPCVTLSTDNNRVIYICKSGYIRHHRALEALKLPDGQRMIVSSFRRELRSGKVRQIPYTHALYLFLTVMPVL